MRKESERDGELRKVREAAGKLYEMGLDTEKIVQAVGYTDYWKGSRIHNNIPDIPIVFANLYEILLLEM